MICIKVFTNFNPVSIITPEIRLNMDIFPGFSKDGLDESISIMWTGAKVCSSMNNMAYDEFHSYTGTDTKPFIWMNWPVNDYAINYLLMGEGEVFNKTYVFVSEIFL